MTIKDTPYLNNVLRSTATEAGGKIISTTLLRKEVAEFCIHFQS